MILKLKSKSVRVLTIFRTWIMHASLFDQQQNGGTCTLVTVITVISVILIVAVVAILILCYRKAHLKNSKKG